MSSPCIIPTDEKIILQVVSYALNIREKESARKYAPLLGSDVTLERLIIKEESGAGQEQKECTLS